MNMCLTKHSSSESSSLRSLSPFPSIATWAWMPYLKDSSSSLSTRTSFFVRSCSESKTNCTKSVNGRFSPRLSKITKASWRLISPVGSVFCLTVRSLLAIRALSRQTSPCRRIVWVCRTLQGIMPHPCFLTSLCRCKHQARSASEATQWAPNLLPAYSACVVKWQTSSTCRDAMWKDSLLPTIDTTIRTHCYQVSTTAQAWALRAPSLALSRWLESHQRVNLSGPSETLLCTSLTLTLRQTMIQTAKTTSTRSSAIRLWTLRLLTGPRLTYQAARLCTLKTSCLTMRSSSHARMTFHLWNLFNDSVWATTGPRTCKTEVPLLPLPWLKVRRKRLRRKVRRSMMRMSWRKQRRKARITRRSSERRQSASDWRTLLRCKIRWIRLRLMEMQPTLLKTKLVKKQSKISWSMPPNVIKTSS